VKAPPDRIDEPGLSCALRDRWGLAPARLGHLPVGFGGHHWELADSDGRRWFVTVAELTGGSRGTDAAAEYADLLAAMDTVVALARAGLEFALAPTLTTDGRSLAPLGGEHAIAVFPFIEGADGGFEDEVSATEVATLIDMLARLHGATPLAEGMAPLRRPELAARSVLDAALRELDQPWDGGPYSEPARQLLARHASPLGRALVSFDELVGQAHRNGPPVLTHGEPHGANILRSAGRLYLIDWDTVGLALPERDLWMVTDAGSAEADRYAELTGRGLSTDMMRMYRIRWSLDEIMLSLIEFRGPHGLNADTAMTWEALSEETESLLQVAL
jgi:spectinomycin phosphotransferase